MLANLAERVVDETVSRRVVNVEERIAETRPVSRYTSR